jgi:hypothetical protein
MAMTLTKNDWQVILFMQILGKVSETSNLNKPWSRTSDYRKKCNVLCCLSHFVYIDSSDDIF